jgi:hypothetical protein
MTEQGTPYALTANECAMVARQGTPYNPYRQQRREARQASTKQDAATGPAPIAAVLEADQVAGYGDIAVSE